MPKKRARITAAEFVEQLKDDAQYQSAMVAQRQRAFRIRAEAELPLGELHSRGYPAESLSELRQKYVPLPTEIVEILLKWLPLLAEPALQEQIVRNLVNVEAPFDPGVLIRLFESTLSEAVRWAIANTLAELRPLSAREWVIDALRNRQYGRAREMLPLALARIAPSDEANRVIAEVFDEMPAHAAIGLAESGGALELELIKARTECEKGWVRKELQRAAKRIERRFGQ